MHHSNRQPLGIAGIENEKHATSSILNRDNQDCSMERTLRTCQAAEGIALLFGAQESQKHSSFQDPIAFGAFKLTNF
jgi:hypothetical protein